MLVKGGAPVPGWGLRDRFDPVAVALVAAPGGGREDLLQPAGNRARVAEDPVVHLPDGHDLGGRAGEEGLVGQVQVGADEVGLADLEALALGDVDDAVAGEAGQAAGGQGRRVESAVADGEDVLARPVGHVPVGVEQDGLVIAGLDGLGLGQRGVDVLAGGLGRRRDDVGVEAPPGAELDPDPGLERLLAQVGAPRPAGDDHADRGVERVEADLAVAEVDERADVAGRQLVHGDQVLGHLDGPLEGDRRLHVGDLGAPVEPLVVGGGAEDGRPVGGGVGADALEHPPAVVQGGGEHVDAGLVPVDVLPVHPDLAAWRDRHRRPPVSLAHRPPSPPCRPGPPPPAPAVATRSPSAWVEYLAAPGRTATAPASTAAAASRSPRWSRRREAESAAATGLALPVPAMSGADPWTGSNSEGDESGLRLALAAVPRPPAMAAPRSVRMSPNRLSVTITSNRPGSLTRYRQGGGGGGAGGGD